MLKQLFKKLISKHLVSFYYKIIGKKNLQGFYNVGRVSYSLSQNSIRNGTEIGAFTSIAINVQIGPGNHPTDYLSTSPFYHYNQIEAPWCDDAYSSEFDKKIEEKNLSKKCIIGNDVWIGTNVVIMQGIKIGDGAVIGAGSVVTKDVLPYAIVGGVPAKIIKFRFEKEIISKLLELKWWNLPISALAGLPFDDVVKSLHRIEELRNIRKKKENICFIITSVIYYSKEELSYSKIRSAYNYKERIEQTLNSISSIREICPQADIILVDGGNSNPEKYFINLVEKFIYVGDINNISKAINSSFKGLGEAKMILKIIDEVKTYDFLFKLSGRYFLNKEFKMEEYDFEAFNFKNYLEKGKIPYGESGYLKGSHSTRLYGFPNKYLMNYEKAMKKIIFDLTRGKSIERVIAKYFKKCRFYYHKTLGVSGCIAVDGTIINE